MKPKKIKPSDTKIDPISGIFRVDGIPILRFCRQGEFLLVQFLDGYKARVEGRGTNLVEMPVDDFISCIQDASVSFEG